MAKRSVAWGFATFALLTVGSVAHADTPTAIPPTTTSLVNRPAPNRSTTSTSTTVLRARTTSKSSTTSTSVARKQTASASRLTSTPSSVANRRQSVDKRSTLTAIATTIAISPTTALQVASSTTSTTTTLPVATTSTSTTSTTSTTTTSTTNTTSTTTTTTTTSSVPSPVSGTFAGYLGGQCWDGSNQPFFWGSDGVARAGACPSLPTTIAAPTTVAQLAAPAFTLSSGTLTTTQNVAITSYSINSSGGTIANYSISPALNNGTLAFNTTTGLVSGTPTNVQGSTTYTVTATNATSTATRTFTITVTAPTCAQGGTCALGDTGPGGGVVFYVHVDADNMFTSTGSTCNTSCKYLESALTDSGGAQTWCSNNNLTLNVTTTAVGGGMANTTTADITCTATSAIQSAANYSTTVNGTTYSDWHLPSKDELNELYTNRARVLGFSFANYWTSTESSAFAAWQQIFPNDGATVADQGFQSASNKGNSFRVRPVRAFG